MYIFPTLFNSFNIQYSQIADETCFCLVNFKKEYMNDTPKFTFEIRDIYK